MEHNRDCMLRTILIIILALVLVGIVGGIVFYFQKTHQALKVAVVSPTPQAQTKIITITPVPSASANPQTTSTPQTSANAFYTSYINCVSQNGGNCDYKSSPYVDSITLTTNLNAKPKAPIDNIICAQNSPSSFSVINTNTNGDSSTVTVQEMFGTTPQPVSVNLMFENGVWKITNVTCPTH